MDRRLFEAPQSPKRNRPDCRHTFRPEGSCAAVSGPPSASFSPYPVPTADLPAAAPAGVSRSSVSVDGMVGAGAKGADLLFFARTESSIANWSAGFFGVGPAVPILLSDDWRPPLPVAIRAADSSDASFAVSSLSGVSSVRLGRFGTVMSEDEVLCATSSRYVGPVNGAPEISPS